MKYHQYLTQALSHIKWLWLLSLLLITLPSQLPAEVTEKVTHYHYALSKQPFMATDQDGKIVWETMPHAFGGNLPIHPNMIKFDHTEALSGHIKDKRTGLIYMQGRYYDPRIDRFLGIDPARVSPTNIHQFNRYAYANNNPYRYYDPDGRMSQYIGTTIGYGIYTANAARIGLLIDQAVKLATVGYGAYMLSSQMSSNSSNGNNNGSLTGGTGNPDPCSLFPELCSDKPISFENNRPNDIVEGIKRNELIKINGVWYVRGSWGLSRAQGNYEFVTINGRNWVSNSHRYAGHHNLSRGASKVDYAGTVRFGRNKSSKGQVQWWTNDSGHYAPVPKGANQTGFSLDKFQAWVKKRR